MIESQTQPPSTNDPGEAVRPGDIDDATLDRYRDDDLPPAERERVAATLRRSPTLRARLATANEFDRRLCEALAFSPGTANAGAAHGAMPGGLRRLAAGRLRLALAASLAVAGGLTLTAWLRFDQPARLVESTEPSESAKATPDMPATHANDNPVPVTEMTDAVRVLISIPVARESVAPDGSTRIVSPRYVAPGSRRPSGARLASRDADSADEAVASVRKATDDAWLAEVDALLLDGRALDVAGLLAAAEEPKRAAAYERLGAALRSALTAERVLDRLEPSEQLAACRAWASDPRLRPVTFDRLRALSHHAHLAAEIRAVIEEMNAQPALQPWLRSYGLATSNAAGVTPPSSPPEG